MIQTHQVLIRHDRGRDFRRDAGNFRDNFTRNLSVGGGSTSEQHRTGSSQQVTLKDGFGKLDRTVQKLPRKVLFQAVVAVEVEGFLREFGEETELVDRAFTGQTGEADTVHTATVLGEGRQLVGDRSDVLGRTIEVAIRDGCAGRVDALIVDVAVIEQRDVFEHLDRLAVVLRHVDRARKGHEELLLPAFDQGLLQPEEGVHLVRTGTVNARLLTVDGSVVIQHRGIS